MNNKKLPMRDGVGVIILNKNNQVFVAKRKDNPIDKWQMPQGGVNPGESYISAMKRELFEETSIKSIEILKEINGFFEYELPDNLVGIIWKGKFKDEIYDLSYEKLVNNNKEEIERLLDFCELEWDENCLYHHKNKKVVATASLAQVRVPVYKSSINKWKNVENQLVDLKKIIN